MSARSELAERIAGFLRDNNLCNPYGGDVSQMEGKGKPYYTGFSRPCSLDGQVTVYGEKFIQVKYQTRFLDLPRDDNRIFTSEQNAIAFLRLAFVEHKGTEALLIPVKEQKAS